jgi:hypothetical protein
MKIPFSKTSPDEHLSTISRDAWFWDFTDENSSPEVPIQLYQGKRVQDVYFFPTRNILIIGNDFYTTQGFNRIQINTILNDLKFRFYREYK